MSDNKSIYIEFILDVEIILKNMDFFREKSKFDVFRCITFFLCD